MLPVVITLIIIAISIVIVAIVIMLQKKRKQGQDATHDSESLITERGDKEASIEMNMQAVQCELRSNIDYGCSLPNEAQYAEVF